MNAAAPSPADTGTARLRPRKAVFPLGCMGARMLPASKTVPAEMLPIIDKPLIQYAVEEAYAAGIREMVFVTGRDLRTVEDHFDLAFELECKLELSDQHDLLQLIRSITPDDMLCMFVRQPRMLGVGHALLCVEHLLGTEPFAVLLPHELMPGSPPVLQQMLDAFALTQTSVLAAPGSGNATQAPCADAPAGAPCLQPLARYTGKIGTPASGGDLVGRYVFTSAIFEHLHAQGGQAEGLVSLNEAINRLAEQDAADVLLCESRRYDCSTRSGCLRATIDMALLQGDLASELAGHLDESPTHELLLRARLHGQPAARDVSPGREERSP